MLPKQENLSLAREMAVQALWKSDLAERAARSGSFFEIAPEGENRIGLRYLNREFWLSFPRGTVRPGNGGSPLSLREEVLILHYLEKAPGIPEGDGWVSFSEVPGGSVYHPVFQQRCKVPLVKYFGEEPERLLSVAADEVGGEPWNFGDVGFRVQAFPRVSLGLVLWKGDAEFPPEGNVLFHSSIGGYLSVEDIVVLAETAVWKIIKAKSREQRVEQRV